VSLGYESRESPPDGTDVDVWDGLLAMKFVQAFCGGLSTVLAGPALSKDRRVLAVRTVSGGVRAIASVTYGSVAVANQESDL
jgi:hypothetical protein